MDSELAGYKFRRQYPIGGYIVDVTRLEAKLIIEIDGGQDAENSADIGRDAVLAHAGFEVLRVWNSEVFQNTVGVLESF